MYRKFIGTVAAAAITLTAIGAAPARADDKDVARAAAAILGIAVVGAIINKHKKDAHTVTRHRHQHSQTVPRQRHAAPAQRRLQPRPLPDRVNKRLLPGQCLRTFETRRGTQRGFGNRCLQNNYRFARALPQHCRVQVRTRQGKRSFYQARCLRQQGYRLARR